MPSTPAGLQHEARLGQRFVRVVQVAKHGVEDGHIEGTLKGR